MPYQPLTCLVVDDSEMDRFTLRRVLHRLEPELQLVMVTTLEEARRCLSAGGVDFVVLDNSLPDGNGADFVMELSEDVRFDGIPVLIVTGWPSPFIFAKAKMANVKHVLAKDQLRGESTLGLIKECIAAARAAQRETEVPRAFRPGLAQAATERHRARQRREH
ncbi:response regulator [Pacificoceanicola onchidii]|uniref:response regulator n=1 Tax=Pacificoceanicola onchidii TaxID=2562685 RepID=UPI0010A45F9E|nr:response regulator [Pacificoceanicola onchidii]